MQRKERVIYNLREVELSKNRRGLSLRIFIFYLTLLFITSFTTTASAAAVSIQDGEDWSLPSWITGWSPYGGIYQLWQFGVNVPYNNTNVDVRRELDWPPTFWRHIHIGEGQFDWTILDNRIQTIANAGKKYMLYFYASGIGRVSEVPSWVRNLYPDTPTAACDVGTCYKMWTTGMGDKFKDFITALGNRYKNDSRVAYIQPFAEVQSLNTRGKVPVADIIPYYKSVLDATVASAGAAKIVHSSGTHTNLSSLDTYALSLGTQIQFTGGFNPAWENTERAHLSHYYDSVTGYTKSLKQLASWFGMQNEEIGVPYEYAKMLLLYNFARKINWVLYHGFMYMVQPGKILTDPKTGYTYDGDKFVPLRDYIRKTLGYPTAKAPDAFAVLREMKIKTTLTPMKNIEKFLYQRDGISGGLTTKTELRIWNDEKDVRSTTSSLNLYGGYNSEGYEARSTDKATGNNYIYFGLDDAFINGGSNNVQIKVYYKDVGTATWRIEYDASDGNKYKSTQSVTNTNTGTWKTATFTINDAKFSNGQGYANGIDLNSDGDYLDVGEKDGLDFRIYNGGSQNITVGMVRLLRLDNPSVSTNTTPPTTSIPYQPYPFAGNPDMGLFSLGSLAEIGDRNNNFKIKERYITNPLTVGLTLHSGSHLTWSPLNPEDGEYNWSLLDKFVNVSKSYYKRYIFNIENAVGAGWNFNSPHWVYAKGATKLAASGVWIRLKSSNYSPDVQPLRWSGYNNENKIPYNDPVGNGLPDIVQVDDASNSGKTKVVNVGGREARSTDKAASQNYIYFKVDDKYINNPDGFQKYKDISQKAVLTLTYFDIGSDIIKIEYDSTDGPYTLATSMYADPYDFVTKGRVNVSGIQRTNTGKWKTASFWLYPPKLRFANGQNGGYDIRISSTGSQDIIIDYLEVSLVVGGRSGEMDPAPNWYDEVYFNDFKRFLQAINEKYGKDEALDLIRMGGYGRWSEMSISLYGNKDWINILSKTYGINATDSTDPLREIAETSQEIIIQDPYYNWRWPRHENLIKKFIDLYNDVFINTKPVEFSVKVPFSAAHPYSTSLVRLADYAATKPKVVFNQSTYAVSNPIYAWSSATNAVQRYWENKINTHEGASRTTNWVFFGTQENQWIKKFRPISGWINEMKEILANHVNYAYIYVTDTDMVNYDPNQDSINTPEEKAIAKSEAIKALRYLATHLGYQIETKEPELVSSVSAGKTLKIKTKWYQKGNGKAYQDFKIFFALKNENNESIDLGAYSPSLPTSKWRNDYSLSKTPFVKSWQATDPVFYVEDIKDVVIPASTPKGTYKLITGLITDKGYRIKLANGRDEQGTITPSNLTDDVFGKDYYESVNFLTVTSSGTSDTTPPTTPIVIDEGISTASTTTLYANWSSSDPESGIAEYQYRITRDSTIGTVIRDWTSTGVNNSVTTTGLALQNSISYYFGVKARNGAGLWSLNGYSDGITVNVSSTNHPPVLSSIGNQTVNENGALSFSITASDPDADTLTYSATGLPQGSSFNSATRTFSWTPTSTQAGDYSVTFSVSDGRGGSELETITITVNGNDVNRTSPQGSISINSNAA